MDYNQVQIQHFETRFEAIIGVLEEAYAQTLGGQSVNLGTIEKQIDTLCNDVKTSDPKIAHHVQPLMGQMISKLDDLADALNDFKQRLSEDNA